MPTISDSITRVIGCICAAIALGSCQTPPSRVDENFGSSVRNTIALQTDPNIQTGYGMDGEKAQAVIDIYRTDVAKPEKVEQDLIEINLGE